MARASPVTAGPEPAGPSAPGLALSVHHGGEKGHYHAPPCSPRALAAALRAAPAAYGSSPRTVPPSPRPSRPPCPRMAADGGRWRPGPLTTRNSAAMLAQKPRGEGLP
ncbi:unnamed protein product [Coccothraustes coccothraustes]